MIQIKKYLPMAKLNLPLACLLTASLAAGCSKKEPAAEHSEMKMTEPHNMASMPAPAVVTAEPKNAPAPEKPVQLAPLSPDIMQMVASNRTMTAFDQIYYITNASISDFE